MGWRQPLSKISPKPGFSEKPGFLIDRRDRRSPDIYEIALPPPPSTCISASDTEETEEVEG
ncbi:MAG: hypothetical protein EBE86_003060 [Hormoscilla sp. GUM202]|nr:hypothetical protein [Hormoscilla sp. GUM202]